MTKNNPLLQEQSEYPTITITLPTGGIFYDEGVLASSANPNDLEIGTFTMWDEVNWRNPYAIMSGKATKTIINNVAKDVLKPDELCAIDVDMMFIAARQASYGNNLEMDVICENEECKKDSKVSVRLDAVLLRYKSLEPMEQWSVILPNNQTVQVKPVKYTDLIDIIKVALENKRRSEDPTISDEVKQSTFINELVEKQVEMMRSSIMFVTTSDGTKVIDREHINEWLDNLPASWFEIVKEKTQEVNDYNSKAGSVEYKCPYCEHEQLVNVTVDPTRFFGSASVE